MPQFSKTSRTTPPPFNDEFGRDSHHGDLRKGAYLRRRADYRSQLCQRSTSQDLHQTKGLGTG